ncbi:hypothetical protein [Thermincola potens]|uniref:TRAP dicarboxylate transporter-DctM subunit n=1 Tax=Thermincola potens (strain JR) TaxID=635013 RepID=D5XAJ5_THEPJ|nr:hypothetical protein [Thermincola potens]ADG81294.1 TRAP dicarboxylate transporter-DctM subunit [Thermincola potens JR]
MGLLVFAAVAVAILLIFGSAAVLAAVIVGLIGAATVGIYAAIVGEDGFSIWTAIGLCRWYPTLTFTTCIRRCY